MSAMASQVTGVSIVCSTACSGADQGKHQSSASLALVMEIHRSPVNSPHKGPVTRKLFSFDDGIMIPTLKYVVSSSITSKLLYIYGGYATVVKILKFPMTKFKMVETKSCQQYMIND